MQNCVRRKEYNGATLKPSFNKDTIVNSKNNNKKTAKNSNKRVTNPYDSLPQGGNQIISGYFVNEKSYKEIIIQRFNNFLYCVLAMLVISCFIGYYFVSCKEVQLNKISRETLELNYENDELQNKLDGLQSYYNIDKAISKANILERAQNVVEVSAINMPDLSKNKNNKNKRRSLVISY